MVRGTRTTGFTGTCKTGLLHGARLLTPLGVVLCFLLSSLVGRHGRSSGVRKPWVGVPRPRQTPPSRVGFHQSHWVGRVRGGKLLPPWGIVVAAGAGNFLEQKDFHFF